MFKSHSRRVLPPVAIAILIVGLAPWGTCVPAAYAAPQDPPTSPERIGLQLDVVVTRSATEPGDSETPESRTWRLAALTTSGQPIDIQNAYIQLEATLSRLEDGRFAVAFNLAVYSRDELEAVPRRPGPPNTLVIAASADEVVLTDDAATVVAALTEGTGRTVEVTFTATVGTNAR